MDTRALASLALAQVMTQHQPLDTVLAHYLPKLADASARALAQELCFGVLRWHLRLDAVALRLLHSPVKDPVVHCLLLSGLYQLMYLRVAPHAAVDLTVTACKALGKPWARGMVNAVLRGYLRDPASLLEQVGHAHTTALSHPAWLLDALKHDWPLHWQDIAHANNERPPLVLRVNALKSTREDYLQQLSAAAIAATPLLHTTHGVQVEKPQGVDTLPGFNQGFISVQDSAAQLAVPLLRLAPGQRVLDACAAPGGKTCHILEQQPGLEVFAIDNKARRVKLIQQGLARLDLHAQLITGDASTPGDWWDGVPFERILLDAPCSATGVIRRHPDIKLLRQSSDIDTLVQRQQQMLCALWPLLSAGGLLLYVTCSVLARENEEQIWRFLSTHHDARSEAIVFPWRAQGTTIGQQILAGEQNMDGFYFAALRKVE